jgi:hypothetical protein
MEEKEKKDGKERTDKKEEVEIACWRSPVEIKHYNSRGRIGKGI